MKYIISNYNNDISWRPKYTDDYVIYNQGQPIDDPKAIQVPHRGTDICDKFSFIIDNYDNLPDVAVYCKGNLWKFISYEEFDKIKDNQTFTPILTQHHKTNPPICWYEDGMYCEINNYWYLPAFPTKNAENIKKFFKMDERPYNKFAPGSNYILTKKNILKHPKSVYKKLRRYLDWGVYPGDAQLIERNLYYLWR